MLLNDRQWTEPEPVFLPYRWYGSDKCAYIPAAETLVPVEDRDEAGYSLTQRLKSGVEHETRVFDLAVEDWATRYSVVDLRSEDRSTRDARAAATAEAMSHHTDLIVGGRLPKTLLPASVQNRIINGKHGNQQKLWHCGTDNCDLCEQVREPMTAYAEPDLLIACPDGGYYPADVKAASGLRGVAKPRIWEVSDLKNPGYECATAPMFGTEPGLPRVDHSYQLVAYRWMLQALGYAAVTSHAAIIDINMRVLWRDLDAAYYERGKTSATTKYVRHIRQFLDTQIRAQHIHAGHDTELPVEPGLCSYCAECAFKTSCRNTLELKEDLTLLPGVGAKLRNSIRDGMVSVDLPATVGRLAASADGEALDATDGSWGFGTNPNRILVFRDQARAALEKQAYRRRGVTQTRMQEVVDTLKTRIRVFTDFENLTIPSIFPPGLLYNIGTLTGKRVGEGIEGGFNHRFTSYWLDGSIRTGNPIRYSTDNPPCGHEMRRLESELISRWWRNINELYEEADGDFKAFVYSPAEERILVAKAKQLEGFPGVPTREEVNLWFRPETKTQPETARIVDLCAVLEQYVHLPLPNRQLKKVAQWVGFQWADDDPSGLSSTYWALEAFTADNVKDAHQWRDRIAEYNKDDCAAVLRVSQWLGDAKFPNITEATRWKQVRK